MASFQFNAANVAPDAGRIAVPTDWYVLAAEKSEIVPTKDGLGLRLNVQFGIQEGPYKGQKVFHGFNTKNESVKAMEISYAQLSAWMHAVGVLDIQDTSQLHDLPFRAKVKLVPAEMNNAVTPPVELYAEKNEISAFKSMADAIGKSTATAMAPQTKVLAPPSASAPAPGGWKPQGTAAPAAPPAQAAPSAGAPPPAWTQPATPQPWQDPNAGAAPTTGAAAQDLTSAPSPATASAPETAPPQAIVPPWMQQQQQ